MIEVAALEVREKIKKVDASFTWPHSIDKGYFVNATFVRTEDDTPYLIYCPKTSTSISIDEETLSPFYLTATGEEIGGYKTVTLTQQMQSSSKEVLFYILRLSEQKLKEIKKDDIEKLFGIKVVG